jgi:hypothetical protein
LKNGKRGLYLGGRREEVKRCVCPPIMDRLDPRVSHPPGIGLSLKPGFIREGSPPGIALNFLFFPPSTDTSLSYCTVKIIERKYF